MSAATSSTTVETPSMLQPQTGPAPEAEIVRDLIRRALPFVPAPIAVAAVFAGTDGALSAGFAVVMVLANFALAAASLAWAARINLAALMGMALFGYVVRLGILFVAVLLIRDMAWVHMASLGCTLVVTHLGLLAWELKYVSASLAHPALKPAVRAASTSTDDKEPTR